MRNALRRTFVGALAAVICSLSILQFAKAHEDPAARALLRAKAMEGSAEAAFELGLLLEPQEVAFEWFAQAAERGHLLATCKVAKRDPSAYWQVTELVTIEMYQGDGTMKVGLYGELDSNDLHYRFMGNGAQLCDFLLRARLRIF